MNILITGASGFIGRHVLRLLDEQKYDILAVSLDDHPDNMSVNNVKWFKADIGEYNNHKWEDILRDFNPEATMHLAWEGIPDYGYEMSRRNLDNSIRISNFVIENTSCRKIIVSGSCWEYGKIMGICRESDKISAKSYFSWAKNSLNEYLNVKCKEHNVDLKWLRLFYVYGPGQKGKSLIPSIIRAFTYGNIPDIRNYLNRNDYVYIQDAAKAFLLALKNNTPQRLYNVGCGKTVSVEEIVKLIASTMRIEYAPNVNNCSNMQENFWADTEQIKKDLGWTPEFSFEKGIEETIQYFNMEHNLQ